MMELLVQDFPYSSIVSDLNEKGFRMRDGKPWSRVAVFNMTPRLIEVGPRLFSTEEWKRCDRGSPRQRSIRLLNSVRSRTRTPDSAETICLDCGEMCGMMARVRREVDMVFGASSALAGVLWVGLIGFTDRIRGVPGRHRHSEGAGGACHRWR